MPIQAIDLTVELVDRDAVIQHYQPEAGTEDAFCGRYFDEIKQRVQNTLNMNFCPITSDKGNIITGMASPEDLARATEFFRSTQIPAIKITVSEPRPLTGEVAA